MKVQLAVKFTQAHAEGERTQVAVYDFEPGETHTFEFADLGQPVRLELRPVDGARLPGVFVVLEINKPLQTPGLPYYVSILRELEH